MSWSQNLSNTFPSQRADCRAYPLFLMLPDETEATEVTNFHLVKSHFIWTELMRVDWAQLFSVLAFLSHTNQKNITSHRKVWDHFTNEGLINTQHVWKKKTGHLYVTVVRKESQSFHWWVTEDDGPTGRIPAGTSRLSFWSHIKPSNAGCLAAKEAERCRETLQRRSRDIPSRAAMQCVWPVCVHGVYLWFESLLCW